MDDRGIGVRFPAGNNIHTGSDAHAASYTMGTMQRLKNGGAPRMCSWRAAELLMPRDKFALNLNRVG
jgi:hypothetical protein